MLSGFKIPVYFNSYYITDFMYTWRDFSLYYLVDFPSRRGGTRATTRQMCYWLLIQYLEFQESSVLISTWQELLAGLCSSGYFSSMVSPPSWDSTKYSIILWQVGHPWHAFIHAYVMHSITINHTHTHNSQLAPELSYNETYSVTLS